jgi:hypothetical protein
MMKELWGNTWRHGSMSVYIIAAVLSAAALLGVYPNSAQGGILPKNNEERYELAFWDSVKDSERAEDYASYLEAYPEGHFALLAKARVKNLSDEQISSVGNSDPIETLTGETPSPAPVQTTRPPSSVAAADTPYKVSVLSAQFEALEYSNVRDRPSMRGERLEVIPKGSNVTVTGIVEGRNWYRVQLRSGTTGYTSGELLQPVIAPGEEAGSNESYRP